MREEGEEILLRLPSQAYRYVSVHCTAGYYLE
jgi:hypothetical protein